MYVQLSAALGVANTGTFTFRKNASSQSVTCIITGNSATSCSDTTHSFNVSQGDLLTVQAVFDGTIIVTPNVLIAAQFGNITASGTVNTGTIGQIGYFAANGSAISGLSQFATNAKTATYQVLQADFTACKTIPVASGTFTITLVASGAQPLDGQCIDVVNYGSGVVTIARSGQNINGGTASYLVQSGSALVPSRARVVSNGTDYFIEGGFTNPMTAAGDTIYAGTTGLPARLAGAAGIYRSSGTVPSYAELSGDVTTSGSNVTTLIANQKIRGVGASFDGGGSALTTSALAYVTVPFACTIAAYNVVIDTGTISFDVWKIATGTAKPAIGNSIISGTNWLSISSNTAIHSTTVSGFTSTTVTANDIFAFSIEAVSSATKASVTLQCNAS